MILRSLPDGYRWHVRPAANDGHIVMVFLLQHPRWLRLPTWLCRVDQRKQIDTHGMLPNEFEVKVDNMTYEMAGDLFRRLNVRGWCKQLVY